MKNNFLDKELLKGKNLLVICGPTACGKTRLGVNLALQLNGEIISADSRQVYQGMDIGTGKDLAEYSTSHGEISYHLIDTVKPEYVYSLYNYIENFYSVYREIVKKKNFPVMVGGTGLYIEAVLKNYQVANVPENYILREKLMQENKEKLLNKLKIFTDIYNRTDLSSKKRIVRSLEIAEYSKERPIEWGGQNPPELNPLVICIFYPRDELKNRIDLRLQNRLKEGMLEEVQGLLEKGVSQERMLQFGMEYKYITLYLLKKIDYNTMVEDLRISIHHLAKRQMTWFRGMQRRGIKILWAKRGELANLAAQELK